MDKIASKIEGSISKSNWASSSSNVSNNNQQLLPEVTEIPESSKKRSISTETSNSMKGLLKNINRIMHKLVAQDSIDKANWTRFDKSFKSYEKVATKRDVSVEVNDG